MNSAPLIVFVYNRIEHVKKSLTALNNNYLAKETDLFVFSDSGSDLVSNEGVSAVREYLHTFVRNSSFKSVSVIEAEEHRGLAQSVISGVTSIISQFGRVIVVEDDVVVSRDFLNYMNEALDFYASDCQIWSITGVGYNLKSLKNYPHDVYLVGRMGSDCWGIWEDRWKRIDWKVEKYYLVEKSIRERVKFNKFGRDMFSMLRRQVKGDIDSWAIRADFSQYVNDMQTIHPKKSFMYSIGHDGTGTHHGGIDIFNWKMKDDVFDYYLEAVNPNKEVQRDYKKQYGFWNGLIRTIKYYMKKRKMIRGNVR